MAGRVAALTALLPDLDTTPRGICSIIQTSMFQYRQIRIGLITFALGLATVWSFDVREFGICEVPVDIPEASDTITVVKAVTKKEIGDTGAGNPAHYCYPHCKPQPTHIYSTGTSTMPPVIRATKAR
jgi:hypothetical protein